MWLNTELDANTPVKYAIEQLWLMYLPTVTYNHYNRAKGSNTMR